MALSDFEIDIGGITSVPVTGGIIFLGYKSFGQKNFDSSKFKPKKPAQAKKAEPAKVTSESKKPVETKKETDLRKSSSDELSATTQQRAEKTPIDSQKALEVPDSVQPMDTTTDVPS